MASKNHLMMVKMMVIIVSTVTMVTGASEDGRTLSSNEGPLGILSRYGRSILRTLWSPTGVLDHKDLHEVSPGGVNREILQAPRQQGM